MIRVHRLLALVIAAELCTVTWLGVRRASPERPPIPNFQRLDSIMAAELIDLRLCVSSDDPLSWQKLGDGYLSFGFFSEAEACYAQAGRIGPQSHDLLLRWGVCLDRLGRLADAIARCEQAAAAAGEGRRRDVCLYHIARWQLREQRIDHALETLLSAGDFELAQYELANLQARIGRPDTAAPILDRLLQRYPDELKLNQLRAKVAAALGDTSGAQRCRDMIERSQDRLFVDSTVEYIGLLRVTHGLPRRCAESVSAEAAGRFAAAADALRADQEVEWNLASARRLVRLDFRLDRVDEAIAVLEQMRDRFGDAPEFLEQLGDAAFLQQRVSDAGALWRRAADLRPSARLHQLLAEYYSQTGAAEAAVKHRAFQEFQLGLESYRSNQLTAAIEHFAQTVELDPQHAESWFSLGETQQQTGDVAAAKRSYARCVVLQPHHGRALDAMERLAVVETEP